MEYIDFTLLQNSQNVILILNEYRSENKTSPLLLKKDEKWIVQYSDGTFISLNPDGNDILEELKNHFVILLVESIDGSPVSDYEATVNY